MTPGDQALEHLERARGRADDLVGAMLDALEGEIAEIRRHAENGIRADRREAEAEASRHIQEAQRIAERIVAERQRRIAVLSDGIVGHAESLSAGMEDARRVRAQFESFVRALSEAADRIASGQADRIASGDADSIASGDGRDHRASAA